MNNDYTDEREPLDTKSMLENAFFANLGKTSKDIVSKSENKESKAQISESKFNTEKLLLDLFDIRDTLIESYSKIGIGSTSQPIVDTINKIGSCIKTLGGEAPNFDPFAHISGLQNPILKKNASRVIENTKEAYSIGKIEDANISEDGKTLMITFSGQQDNINYKAIGTIIASKSWIGNEAIDYIYSPSEGRMSVKAFNDDGKWIDKSDSYKISWELFEKEADLNVMPVEVERKEAGKAEDNTEIKEEVKNNILNDNIDEEIGDFPIEEKK